MNKPLQRRFASSRKKPDRRTGEAEAPIFGKLLIEAQWQPEAPLEPKLQNWARSSGLIDDRRLERDRRAEK